MRIGSKAKQPSDAERKLLVQFLAETLDNIDCTAARDPGPATIRRLNRVEYNNTVRDLCQIEFEPAENFPPDEPSHGFDNQGDVLSTAPLLVEKYDAAALSLVQAALARAWRPAVPTWPLPVRPRS